MFEIGKDDFYGEYKQLGYKLKLFISIDKRPK